MERRLLYYYCAGMIGLISQLLMLLLLPMLSRFSMLKRSLSALLLVFLSFACRETHVHEVKNFRLFVETDTPSLKYSVQILVSDYNRRLGSDAMTVVDTREESNSLIHFRKDLIKEGRKLGLGQWISVAKEEVNGSFNQDTTTTIEYGMDILFDLDNFVNKAAYIQDPDSNEYKHLFHLFAHEVGHGMQMDHSDDITSVMYPSIPESSSRDLNYTAYFQHIRMFMAQPDVAKVEMDHDHDHEEMNESRSLAF